MPFKHETIDEAYVQTHNIDSNQKRCNQVVQSSLTIGEFRVKTKKGQVKIRSLPLHAWKDPKDHFDHYIFNDHTK